jgi:hypothetical protein
MFAVRDRGRARLAGGALFTGGRVPRDVTDDADPGATLEQ